MRSIAAALTRLDPANAVDYGHARRPTRNNSAFTTRFSADFLNHYLR